MSDIKAPFARLSAPLWVEEENLLGEWPPYRVIIVRAVEAPALLEVIGRLRAQAFGLKDVLLDLDVFDQYYKHIVVLKDNEYIISAARIWPQDLAERLKLGLYTESLYDILPAFYKRYQNILEIGRLFITPEYKGALRPLLLLWQGVAAYWARYPKYRYLLGSVSLQNPLLASYLMDHRKTETPRYVHAKYAPNVEIHPGSASLIEIPTHIKLFLKMGARLITLGRDPYFNNLPDALMLVDLKNIPIDLMQKFMGKKAYETWRNVSHFENGA